MHEKALEERNEKRKRGSRARIEERLAQRAKLKNSKKLHAVPCFAALGDEAIERMIDCMSYETRVKGDVVCVQGDVADAFYVVCTGRCKVSIVLPSQEQEADSEDKRWISQGALDLPRE